MTDIPGEGSPRARLAMKLLQIMAAVDRVEKRGHNDSQNYNYVRAADVARAIREAAIAQGVVILPSVVRKPAGYEVHGRNGEIPVQSVDMELEAIDVETGESVRWTSIGDGMDSGDKGIYKAMTGALKYGLRLGFLVPDDSDAENEGASTSPTSTAEAAQARTAARRAAAQGVPQQSPVPQAVEQAPPAEQSHVALASNAKKALIRATARAAGLDDMRLKGLATFLVGDRSSTTWTDADADKIIAKLGEPEVVSMFRDAVSVGQAVPA